MGDVDWGGEAKEAPKPKKRVPTWLWFCGGGCLLALVVGVTLLIVGVRLGMEAADPELQWAELKAELPFEEQPEDILIIGTGAFTSIAPGIDDQWTLQMENKPWQVQITKFSGDEATELREQLESGDLGAEAKQKFGPFGLYEFGHGVADVQGRELPWVRFQTFEKTAAPAAEAGGEAAAAEEEKSPEEFGVRDAMKQRILMLDITREGGSGALIAQITKVGPGAPVDVATLVEFLAPFQIGPKR